MSRPPAREGRSSRPPDTPAPPALGSSPGGMGAGVRVGVIVGGGVGVGVLVSTMSYDPAAGREGVVAKYRASSSVAYPRSD